MNNSRDDRVELLGYMKALAKFPATSKVDKQATEIVIPAVIALVEDCNELETQRDEAIARSNRLISELERCSGFHERLAEQRDDLLAALKALVDVSRVAFHYGFIRDDSDGPLPVAIRLIEKLEKKP